MCRVGRKRPEALFEHMESALLTLCVSCSCDQPKVATQQWPVTLPTDKRV